MLRLKRLGWSVSFAELPPRYTWGLFPTDRTVLLQQGLPPSRYRRIIRNVLVAVQAICPEPPPQ
jgi:hypothetical protein